MSGAHDHLFDPPQPRTSIIESTTSVTPRGSQYLAPPTGLQQPDRSLASTPGDSSPFIEHENKDIYSDESPPQEGEEDNAGEAGNSLTRAVYYKRLWFATAAVAVVVLAIILPVYFVLIRSGEQRSKSGNGASSGTGSGSGSNGDGSGKSGPPKDMGPDWAHLPKFGGDGSTVTKEDGSTFMYRNAFGGYWVYDYENPYNSSAQPNSWTPALNQGWTWGKDRIWGVNLGGLFVLEPFIVPSLFQDNEGAVDEWTLSTILAQKGADNLQQTLENHYNTFITEEDIAQIAGAGLNWIRLPIPFWAIETWDDVGVDATGQHVAEPFLARTCWKYILRLLGWARKYGLRVNLDLHTIPGSQNGYNHSGKQGPSNWLKGTMGLANAERSLDYIRIITEFISQPEWKDVIPMFGIINEPSHKEAGKGPIQSFYAHAYNLVRSITGTGEGKGAMILLHDAFLGIENWAHFLPGADRVALDTHVYFAFNDKPNREPINITADGDGGKLGGQWPKLACESWVGGMDQSRKDFGITLAGEFSNAINDCGLFVNNVNADPPHYGDGCEYWEDYANWSDATKQGLLEFALASMDALGDFFFWSWKIGNSTTTNSVQSPLWSYKLGLQEGWMPTDPRQAAGKCAGMGVPHQFDGNYEPWMTGGAGAGNIAPDATANLPWPPAALTNIPAAQMALIPQYTPTGIVPALAPPTFSPTPTVSAGSGWFDPKDNVPAAIPISGCAYPNAWDANGAQIPAANCLPM